MSEVTTLLAWLIPCLALFITFIGWRIHIYRTRGPGAVLPAYLQRNVFARTRSMIPRTLSIGSNKDVTGTDMPPEPTAANAIRNETRIDMPDQLIQMSSLPSTRSAASQSFAPVPYQKRKEVPPSPSDALVMSPTAPVTPGSIGSLGLILSTELTRPPTSPAIKRLVAMK
ncbi:hypothetical protein EDD11_004430 [Mortierella claussenii]|nr:hypothetical protein EDD11_004430 [Mortierella claussenii]